MGSAVAAAPSASSPCTLPQQRPVKKTLRSSFQETLNKATGHVKNKVSRDALPDLATLKGHQRVDKGREKEKRELAPVARNEHRAPFFSRFNSRNKYSFSAHGPASSASDPQPSQLSPSRGAGACTGFQAPSISKATFSSPDLRSPPTSIADVFTTQTTNVSTTTLNLSTPNSPTDNRPFTKRPPISGIRSQLTSPSTPTLSKLTWDSNVINGQRPTPRRATIDSPSKPSNLYSSSRSPDSNSVARPHISSPKPLGSIARPSKINSSSTTHLPLSTSPTSYKHSSVSPPPTPSFQRRHSGSSIRSPSSLASPDSGRARSPSSPRSPTSLISTSGSIYTQNQQNSSAVSLLIPLSPEREAIRAATRFILKEALKPPNDLGNGTSNNMLNRQWSEEMELRTRKLARMERGWSKRVGMGTSSGEERERATFCEALKDGYVLCQLMNKWHPNVISRIDHREDGVSKNSNMSRFISAASEIGVPKGELCAREDFVQCTQESLGRVANTIIALSNLVEALPFAIKAVRRNQICENAGDRTFTASTPSLVSANVTMSKRQSPPVFRQPIDSLPPTPSPPPRSNLRTAAISSPASRTSLASTSAATTTTDTTSVYSYGPNDRFSKFGSVRTNVTEATSMVPSSGHPSLSRSEAKEAAAELTIKPTSNCAPSLDDVFLDMTPSKNGGTSKTGYGWKKLTENKAVPAPLNIPRPSGMTTPNALHELPKPTPSPLPYPRERRISDLKRVKEENSDEDDSAGGNTSSTDGSVIRHESPSVSPALPSSPTRMKRGSGESGNAVRLGKGKWPEDFINVFECQDNLPLASSSARASKEEDELALVFPETPRRKVTIRTGRNLSPSPLSASPHAYTFTPTEQRTVSPTSRILRFGRSVPCSPAPSPSRLDKSQSPLDNRPRSPNRSNSRGPLVPKISLEERARSSFDGGGASTPISPSASSPAVPIPFPRRKSHTDSNRLQMFPSISVGYPLTSIPGSRDGLDEEVKGDDDEPASAELSSSRNPFPTRMTSRTRYQSDAGAMGGGRAMHVGLERTLSGRADDLKRGRRSRYESMMELSSNSKEPKVDISTIRKLLIVKEIGSPPVHFQLGNCIGRGQFGSVYRSLNLNTGQMVAVKQIRLEGLSETEVTQLMKEVELLKRLSHPGIVKYEGMVRDKEYLSIVLEYVENGSLGQTLKAFGKFNEKLVASYVIKILEGLHYLHSSKVVHCDLKAANILTTKNGNVKLSDFGVSLNLHAMENIKNDVAGTPNWMAPEVIELKGASTASDIWSLGCTVIELLTGKPPYAEIPNGLSVMFHIVDDSSPPLPTECSDDLKDFLEKCFNKDPKMRPDAVTLFEHPWLKSCWGEHKELRPQDSLPFLRRVSADLQRNLLAHQISFTASDVPSTTARPLSQEQSNEPPSIEQTKGHAFVRTSFVDAVDCRACHTPVMKKGMLCQACSLICHSRCVPEASNVCDLQEQARLHTAYLARKVAESQLTQQRQRTASKTRRSISPPHPARSGSPSFSAHIMTNLRRIRNSASSTINSDARPPSRMDDSLRTGVTSPEQAHSTYSSTSGGEHTSVVTRASARGSWYLANILDGKIVHSPSPSIDDPPQLIPSTPSPIPPRPEPSQPVVLTKRKIEVEQSKPGCVIM